MEKPEPNCGYPRWFVAYIGLRILWLMQRRKFFAVMFVASVAFLLLNICGIPAGTGSIPLSLINLMGAVVWGTFFLLSGVVLKKEESHG